MRSDTFELKKLKANMNKSLYHQSMASIIATIKDKFTQTDAKTKLSKIFANVFG